MRSAAWFIIATSEARASGTTPEERVVIRSALVLAFAHGANKR